MNDIPNTVQLYELDLYADDMEMHCSSTVLSCAEHDLEEGLTVATNLVMCQSFESQSTKSHIQYVC